MGGPSFLGAGGIGQGTSPILPTLRVPSALPAVPRLPRQESSLSLQQYFQYDTLQQKLKCLEEENQKLRMEVSRADWQDTPHVVHFCPACCQEA